MAETNMTHEMEVLMGTGNVFLADREIIDGDTDFVEFFQTTKDSLTITQTTPDATDLFTDQSTTPIASVMGTGSFDITFSVPSVDSVALGLFFNVSTPSYVPAGKSAISVGTEMKVVEKMMKIQYPNGSEVVFTNINLTGVVSKASDGAFSIDVTGKVLATTGAGKEPEPIIFYHNV